MLVCNNPTNLNRDLDINLPEAFVPMKMNGSICSFVSRCPADEELYSYQKLQISDEYAWDPSAKILISSAVAG